MHDKNSSLLACFIAERHNLSRFLTGRTGCAATAEDLLQDAWLKLNRAPQQKTSVHNPLAYLRRMAANLAIDHARADARRLLDPVEIEALLHVPDETPNAEQKLADTQQLEALWQFIHELPERRREIFIASRVEGLPHKQLAERFSVSVRTVELEVHQALNYCAERLHRLSGDDRA
ncbi:putative RNA polymerase sigma factor FecI [compost metagenome]